MHTINIKGGILGSVIRIGKKIAYALMTPHVAISSAYSVVLLHLAHAISVTDHLNSGNGMGTKEPEDQ